jgi:hypothetical protein
VVVEEIMRKARFRFTVVALGLSVMLAMPAGPLAEYAAAQAQPAAAETPVQVPQPPDNNVNWPGAGYGVGALFCNFLYIPAKLVYALLGGIIGGGTFLVTVGNMQAANTVWRSTLGGDYVVTPQMLAGEEPLNFSGPTETPPEAPSTSSSSGSVAPIAPLPAPGSSASGSSPAGGLPLDRGSGPKGAAVPNSNVE